MLPGRHPRPTRLCRVALGLVLCGVTVGCSHAEKLPAQSDRPTPLTRLPSPNNVDPSAKPGPASLAAAEAADAAAAAKVPPPGRQVSRPVPQGTIGLPPTPVETGMPPVPGQQSPMGGMNPTVNNVAAFPKSPAQPQTGTANPPVIQLPKQEPPPASPPSTGGISLAPPVAPPQSVTIPPPPMPGLPALGPLN